MIYPRLRATKPPNPDLDEKIRRIYEEAADIRQDSARGAAALLRRALEKAQVADGKDGLTVALILNMLAAVVEPKEGVLLLSRALAIDKAALGPSHPQTLRDVRKLSSLLRETGRTSEATQLERQFKTGPSH